MGVICLIVVFAKLFPGVLVSYLNWPRGFLALNLTQFSLPLLDDTEQGFDDRESLPNSAMMAILSVSFCSKGSLVKRL